MKKIVLILIVLASYLGNAQDTSLINKSISRISAIAESGKNDEAIKGFDSIIAISNGLQKADVFRLKGKSYWKISDYDKSMESFFSALDIYDDLKNVKGQCKTYDAIGVVYYLKGDFTSAIRYGNKALKIATQLKDTSELASIYNNLSMSYRPLGKLDSAIYYVSKSIKLSELKHHQLFILKGYQNLSYYYSENGQFDKAEEVVNKFLNIVRKSGTQIEVANGLVILATCYLGQNKISLSEECFKKAFEISKKSNDVYLIGNTALEIRNFYKKINNFEKALYFNELQDSCYEVIMNKESVSKIEEVSAKYQFDRLNKESKIKDLEVEKKSQAVNYLIVVASLILLTVIIIGFGYSRKKKANSLLETKNKEIEHQKNEIVDSINYAKRIQTATLGSPDRVIELYDNSAVVFQPKDIVSGDFYWFHKIGNRFMFSVADCTGHGVPGAMMSMIGNNGLNDAVKEKDITDPAKILEHLSHQVHTNFNKDVTEIKDGMDISFCVLNTDTKELEFAGAINSLIICKRNGEIVEIKGDKQFIGQKDSTYITHKIQLETDDCVYIMSDGFVDQFGGADNKKFKISKFKELLPTINSHEAQYQAGFLTSTINDWKGVIEQTDDICVMVVKI